MSWLARLATALFRAYAATLSIEIHHRDGTIVPGGAFDFGREIFAVLERDLFALGGLALEAPFTALVAPGRDGDWATAIATRLGCRVIRGSSLDGGARALHRLKHELDDSPGPALIAVDGPLGPAGVAQGGAVALGMFTGRPLCAAAAACRWRLTIPATWSGLYLPWPFSRVVIQLDEPMELPEVPSVAVIEQLRGHLSERLRELTARAGTAVLVRSGSGGRTCYDSAPHRDQESHRELEP